MWTHKPSGQFPQVENLFLKYSKQTVLYLLLQMCFYDYNYQTETFLSISGFSGNPDCCAPTCPAKCSNRSHYNHYILLTINLKKIQTTLMFNLNMLYLLFQRYLLRVLCSNKVTTLPDQNSVIICILQEEKGVQCWRGVGVRWNCWMLSRTL